MNFYNRAIELKNETIKNRRFIHKNAEAGLDLPATKKFVKDKLTEYGLKPIECGYGIISVIGKGEPIILLRADMDALPMKELSGEDFSSVNQNYAHTCGHDMHTAMLLTAAKMLKEEENQLKGTIKFMFQPGEEILEGCINMIENGVLKNPSPDVALAFHVGAGKIPPGTFMYNSTDTMMLSVDNFTIKITGKGGHGAYPNLSVDPINIGVKIYNGLESIIAREANPDDKVIISIGKFQGGTVGNIIPDKVVLSGALRTNCEDERNKLKIRIKEIAQKIGEAYGGNVKVEFTAQIPTLKCDEGFTETIISFIKELKIDNEKYISLINANASEDFALIAKEIPSAYIYLSAGFADERGEYYAHNPMVRFNEEVCSIGSACMAYCSFRYLEEMKKKKTEK